MALLRKGQVPPGYNLDKFSQAFGRKMHGGTPKAINSIPEFSGLKASLSHDLKPSTNFDSFMKMHFRVNGTAITGQTILRNVGTGKRNDRNLLLIKEAVGRARADFSEPGNAIDTLASIPGVNLRAITFDAFCSRRIDTPLFTGRASKFLHEAIAPYRALGMTRPGAFYYFILSAGIDRRDHTLEPEQLKEVLDSAGFDFGNKFICIKDFIRMRFHSPHLITTSRNCGTITGQSLLHRYAGRCVGCTTKTMERILREAGYARPDLSSPDAVRKILASAKKRVDWAAVRYKEFKYLRFDSAVFRGIGITWLNDVGDGTAKCMRILLRKIGIINKPSSRWTHRIR
ncbi:Uncharacterised protein [uncultured archaeon]|nr:Uncharacterised protein [uncultured archaeon]